MGLQLQDVTVEFDGKRAVDGVSIDIPTGEVFALIGPSGSGKSSLLRAIAGLEACTGDIRWDDESVLKTPVHRRGFVLMFQDGQLFPHLDVAGNVGYSMKVSGHRDPARVEQLLALVGLAGFGARRVTDLSGGEQQRVALARSLAATPRLLLLDEPLSSIDRELRERLAGDLHDILHDAGVTTIVVTHDHEEAAVIADRIGILEAGRLVQVGTLTELRAHPVDDRVARFLS
ncbi:MAG: ABC transporter ATP-binding protein [Pseudolysinimonas sp.]